MSTILSRPEYHVWQEWKWNRALGIHRGSPFQVLTALIGTNPANHACAPTTTPLELTAMQCVFLCYFYNVPDFYRKQKIQAVFHSQFLPEASIGLRVLSLPASVAFSC